MFYPDHHIRTYCIYLGSFDRGDTKVDFGVYKRNNEVSHAIVFGDKDSEYISGEFIFNNKLISPAHRFKSLYSQLNERLYEEYLKNPRDFPQP